MSWVSYRQVSAAAVAVTWSHLACCEAILGGQDPAAAFAASADEFFTWLLPRLMAGIRPEDPFTFADTVPLPECAGNWPADSFEWATGDRVTTRCFLESAEQNRRALLGGGGLPPLADVQAADCDEMAWLLDAARIYATGGGSLCQAARSAYDRHLGKPRRRRAPVEQDWLAARLDRALDAAWHSLRPWGRMLPDERPRPRTQGGDAHGSVQDHFRRGSEEEGLVIARAVRAREMGLPWWAIPGRTAR